MHIGILWCVVNCNIALKICAWTRTQVKSICFSYSPPSNVHIITIKHIYEHKFSRTYDAGEILWSFVSVVITISIFLFLSLSRINALPMLYGCKLYVFWHLYSYEFHRMFMGISPVHWSFKIIFIVSKILILFWQIFI